AQQTATVNNGVRLWIGMPKADALNALKESSDVQPLDREMPNGAKPDQWCVKPRTEAGGVCDYDTVQFYKDKLIFVHHTVAAVDGDDAAALISKLFVMIKAAEEAGFKASVHSGFEHESNNIRQRVLSFQIGDNTTFVLSISQPI